MTRTILYVEASPSSAAGGSHFSLLQLVRKLDRGRYRPVVAFLTDNPVVAAFRAAGAEVHVAPPPRPRTGAAGGRWAARWRQLGAERRQFAFVLRTARAVRADLVHFNNGITPNRAGLMASAVLRLPAVCHERKIRRYSRLDRRLGRLAHHVVAISSEVHGAILRGGAGRAANVVRIHNAADPDDARPARPPAEVRRSLGLPEGAAVMGIVGRLLAWKGQHIVIRALAELGEEFPDLHCLVVGEAPESGRAYARELRRLAVELRVDDRVHFTGFLHPVSDAVQLLDVVVHASTEPEPFGRALLDAMALSRPLLASDAGGPREIVQHGVTGLLVAPGDPAALAGAVASLLRDPVRAAELGRAGRERLGRDFGVDAHVRRIHEVYTSLGVGSG